MAEFVPYHTAIPPALYPTLATLLLIVGLMFVASFFVYEITTSAESSRKKRSLAKEISLAFPASLFLGFGSLFLLLWTNVYV